MWLFSSGFALIMWFFLIIWAGENTIWNRTKQLKQASYLQWIQGFHCTTSPEVHPAYLIFELLHFTVEFTVELGSGVTETISGSWWNSLCWGNNTPLYDLPRMTPDFLLQHWLGLCLEVVPRLVLRLSGCKVVLQESLQVLKGGPLFSISFPALQH